MQAFARARPLVNLSCLKNQKRTLFRYLVNVFNSVDENKIKEVGPDVAAAQWLVRNGAAVKWGKSGRFTDYDKIQADSSLKQDYIVEIDAHTSGISHVGFPYLKNLKGVEKITFNDVEYLQDEALILLAKYQLPTLKHLEIIKCHDVTDVGVLALKTLKGLTYLKLEDLASVKDMKACVNVLRKDLPKCKIESKILV